MKWFYSIVFTDGRKHGRGPFDSEAEAEADKTEFAVSYPTAVPGDVFEAAADYQFPNAMAIIARGDGSQYFRYSDGSTTDIV